MSNASRWNNLGGKKKKSSPKKKIQKMSTDEFLALLNDIEDGKVENFDAPHRSDPDKDYEDFLVQAMQESISEEPEEVEETIPDKTEPVEEPEPKWGTFITGMSTGVVDHELESVTETATGTVTIGGEEEYIVDEDEEEEDYEAMEPAWLVSIRWIPEIPVVTVTDGILQASVNINEVFKHPFPIYPIQYEMLDADNAGEIISQLRTMIIISRYPSAIYTTQDFVKRFGKISSRNMQNFIFASYKDYVFAYYIDDASIAVWADIESELDSESSIMQFILTLTYESVSIHTMFNHEQAAIIYDLYEKMGNSDAFEEFFKDHVDTVKDINCDPKKVFERLIVIDYEGFSEDTKSMIHTLIHKSDSDSYMGENIRSVFDEEMDEMHRMIRLGEDLDYEGEDEDDDDDEEDGIEELDLANLADTMMGGGSSDKDMTIKVID